MELVAVGKKAYVDLSKASFEFGSTEFLNYHLKNLVSFVQDHDIEQIIYEEESSYPLSKEGTSILVEYARALGEIEAIYLKKEVYGDPRDGMYTKRMEVVKRFLTTAYTNPLEAVRYLESYREPTPDRASMMKSYEIFMNTVKYMINRLKSTKFYNLVVSKGGVKEAFLSLVNLSTLNYIDVVVIDIPEDAVKVSKKEGQYVLPYGVKVQIYEIPEKDIYIYDIRQPEIEELSLDLKNLLRELILNQLKENFLNQDYNVLYNYKINEYKQLFLEAALLRNIPITPRQALLMARDAASWVIGFGAPIENISLDRDNVTDIYIDSENSPIYLDHREFGIVHTLYRYNREQLERAFKNMVLSERGKKFDSNSPVVDVVSSRAYMRCHLQRPPATFGELQGALRLMSEEPFTYAQYLYYKSMTPMFAGYDDVLVTYGSSEAVLGVKGVGKTSFTAAKICAIGTRRRIIPVQDIWEIPVRAYRKRGFHIGAARIASLDMEHLNRDLAELDLVAMANALLRMGDAALIINEVRSKSNVQGIINLLNTQPGVFLLYNLHAESLADIRDRLELVFGIPSSSMFATDRYTFLKKLRFSRRGRTYRVIGFEYESNRKEKKFEKVFELERGQNIDDTILKAQFLKNPEANQREWKDLNISRLSKELDIVFIPPTIQRRADENGFKPEELILQAFYKGYTIYRIYRAAMDTGNKDLMKLDFYLKANNLANKIIFDMEQEFGEVDFGEAQRVFDSTFPSLVELELKMLKQQAI
ncbi:MAG: ATPase, T2SS/T4P/T4SS family [Candidatus Micrarchaeota archaeon]|nr:ATPase, T2SS/T4P/T4SS family [Candidatus Micrarchaeota archaeon]MCX8154745.1 ATPase, T2SS/T4P/T4SS family [Candidatus Micrarchaeota archaeon]